MYLVNYANHCREHHGDHWVTGCGWCAGEIWCGYRGVVEWGWRGVGGVCIGYGWRLRLSLGWGEVEMSWSWGRCRIWGECG